MPGTPAGDNAHLALRGRGGAHEHPFGRRSQALRVGQEYAVEHLVHEGLRLVDDLLHGHFLVSPIYLLAPV